MPVDPVRARPRPRNVGAHSTTRPLGQRGVGAADPGPARRHGGGIEQRVGPRRAQGQHPLHRRPEGPRPRLAAPLAGAHDPVVVAVEERPLGLGRRLDRVHPEPLERPGRVPHLDDRRPRGMGRHVDRQPGVVDDDQARGPHVVRAAHRPHQVAELGTPARSRTARAGAPGPRPAACRRMASWIASRLPSRWSSRAVARTTRFGRPGRSPKTQPRTRRTTLESRYSRVLKPRRRRGA